MITLYWSPQSRAVRMFWALEEIGAPYELKLIDIRAESRDDPPDFLAASPLRKVPALTDGAVKIADSAAIALYLGDRYAAGDLAPNPDDPARGEFLTWLFFTPSAIEPAMTEKFVEMPANPTAYPWGSFERTMAALERRLEGREWIAADRFTMADFMISGTVQFMQTIDVFEPSPTLDAYMERCFSRPAAIRAQEREEAATKAVVT